MNNKSETNVASKQSDFTEIIGRLNQCSTQLNENLSMLYSLKQALLPEPSPEERKEQATEPNDGVVPVIKYQIYKIEDANQKFRILLETLKSIIGS